MLDDADLAELGVEPAAQTAVPPAINGEQPLYQRCRRAR